MGRAGAAGRKRADQEGATRYEAGDYLVSNNRDGSDSYAVTAKKFDDLYVLASDD